MKLEDAIELGQRTFEHFKGYYYDKNLEITDENYLSLTAGKDVWNCPTFYTYKMGLAKDEVTELLNHDEANYVNKKIRAEWITQALDTRSESTEKILKLSRKIFKDLTKIKANIIAGTDCGGGYANMIQGFALLEEMEIMQELGLSPYEVIKTATINPAKAMRKEDIFGTIEIGKRADCILLSSNPLESVESYKKNSGVMLRGLWLSKEVITAFMAQIRLIYSEKTNHFSPDSLVAIKEFAMKYEALRNAGFIGNRETQRKIAEMYFSLEMPEVAVQFMNYFVGDYPHWYESFFALGLLYQVMGNKEEAILNYTRSLKLNPNNKNVSDRINELGNR